MPYLSCTFVDSFGRITRKRIEIEEQVLLADYQTVAGAVANELDPITDLGLLRMDLILSMGESFAVTAGANVDVGATFSGYIDGGAGKKASHKVPGFKTSLVDTDGSIDLTQADVDAYLDLFLAAGGYCELSDGEQISSWISGSLDK